MVLSYSDSLNFNEIMFRLVYARIHISLENIWGVLFYAGSVLQEIEKYGISFAEVNPKDFVQMTSGQVRLQSFQGVLHPYMDLKEHEIVSENLM